MRIEEYTVGRPAGNLGGARVRHSMRSEHSTERLLPTAGPDAVSPGDGVTSSAERSPALPANRFTCHMRLPAVIA